MSFTKKQKQQNLLQLYNSTLYNPKPLTSWCAWFFAGNIILFWVIGLGYLPSLDWLFQEEYKSLLQWPDRISVLAFLAFTYIGHLAILAFLPLSLIAFLMWITSALKGLAMMSNITIRILCVVIATISASLLVADTIVYHLFHFHINGFIFDFLFNFTDGFSNFFSFRSTELLNLFNLSNKEIYLSVGVILILLCIEISFAIGLQIWLQKRLSQKKVSHTFQIGFATCVILCIILSYSLNIPYSIITLRAGDFAAKGFGHTLIETTRILPLYHKVLGTLIPTPDGQLALERISEHKFLQPNQATRPLHYPLESLKLGNIHKPLNIVMIIIDAWRFDMLDPSVTPNVHAFSKKSWVFKHHFSGGNCTAAGIHSLFYSIPPTYWSAMKEQHQSPVFIDTLLKNEYQMNILASAGLTLPAFHRTVFQNIKGLQELIPGKTAFDRDQHITQSFINFLEQAQHNPKPFFSFLFYDSAHAYCQINNNFKPFTPTIQDCNRLILNNKTEPSPYFNRYKNSLLLVDTEVKKVLNALEQHQLLDNTVVIISGDHGEEFNDTKLGFFGHTSNFTQYQLQTPLIIYWPKDKPQTFTHVTTHYDIVPTLMERIFNCQTPVHQYSVGAPLLAAQLTKASHSKPDSKENVYRIAGSYIGFGVIEKNRITSLFPSGEFQITTLEGKPIPNARLNRPVMQAVLHDLKRFYH